MSYCHIDISHRDLTDEAEIYLKKKTTNKETNKKQQNK